MINSRFLPMDSRDFCPSAHTSSADVPPRRAATISAYANKKLLTFPEKLMDIIDSEKFHNAIAWTPDGKAFCITPKGFVDSVLNAYFQGSRFGSFQKKLFRYGFRKRNCSSSSSTILTFQHDLFIKGKPELLEYIIGGKQRESFARTGRLASRSTTLLPQASGYMLPNNSTKIEFTPQISQDALQLAIIAHQVACHMGKSYHFDAKTETYDQPSSKTLMPSLIASADCGPLFERDHILSQLNYKGKLDRYRQLALVKLGYHGCGIGQWSITLPMSLRKSQTFHPQLQTSCSSNYPGFMPMF